MCDYSGSIKKARDEQKWHESGQNPPEDGGGVVAEVSVAGQHAAADGAVAKVEGAALRVQVLPDAGSDHHAFLFLCKNSLHEKCVSNCCGGGLQGLMLKLGCINQVFLCTIAIDKIFHILCDIGRSCEI